MNTLTQKTKFCFECGGPLVDKWHAMDKRTRLACPKCGAIHYDNPKVLVWCLAFCGHRILMCRRAIEPSKGLWNPPSGFVESNESLEEAMARELMEETGIELPLMSFSLYRVASLPHMNQIYVGFRAELATEPTLLPGPECSDVRLFAEGEMPVDQLAFTDMIPDNTSEIYRRIKNRDFGVQILTLRRQSV